MKKLLKKIFVPIFLSVICGAICGRLIFSIYEDKEKNIIMGNTIYLIEDTTYDSYDNMKASTLSTNYIYYKENNKYNVVVAMTKNKDNIEKIKKMYNKELKISKYLISDEELNNTINLYDKKISSSDNNEEIKKFINEMISIYKDRDDIKMVKIS